MKELTGAAVRYGLVGVLNTAVGYAVILALDLGLHLNPFLANAGGYAVGLLISFALSRGFVFRSQDSVRRAGPRYLLAVAAAFGLNQLVMGAARALLPDAPLGHAASQFTGMASYTVALFLISYFWVFPRRSA
ncbi:MAG: GtrA family protein [Caulobacteraceae bacterium]|nr:GtrA family protein [Caulobacteraceae bacterium]